MAGSFPRRSQDADGDDYWSSSNKYRNIFDDEDAAVDFEEDHTELVSWGGDLITQGELSAQSARYRIPKSTSKDNVNNQVTSKATKADNVYNKPGLKSDSSSFVCSPPPKANEDLAASLVDAILAGETPRSDEPPNSESRAAAPRLGGVGSATESAKMQAELNFYKRRAAAAETSRWTSLPVEETVQRVVAGQVYTLETYKSLEEKLALLDRAVQSRDGNALTAVVVFLHKSVKTKIFLAEISSRPTAVHHFLQYLRHTGRTSELVEALGMFGYNEEAAIFKLGKATRIKNPEQKVKSLKMCLQAHFRGDASLAKDAYLVQQQIQLLEVQQPINQSDSEVAAKAKDAVQQVKANQDASSPSQLSLPPEIAIFARFPRPSSLVDLPLLTSLSYCCTYHHGKPSSFFGSPDYFKKTFGISEKQFAWIALKAHARLKRWDEIEKLLKTKSWFGKEKKKVDLDFRKVAAILSKEGAEPRVVAAYLLEVEDLSERLATAVKIECHLAALDAFASDKDRQGLVAYAKKLRPEMDEALHADLLLKNPNIRWKN